MSLNNYYRIFIKWKRRNRRANLPNAIDIVLRGTSPHQASREIDQFILATCQVTPLSWTWQKITKAEYDANNVWVDSDKSSGQLWRSA